MRIPMVENNNVRAFPTPGSEFDAFLFAAVGEETNGMVLSVVSALSRNDLDPWEEAAALSRLPAEAATQSLAAMIGTLPDVPQARAEPFTIAARLVALLPDKSTTHLRDGLRPVAAVASKTPAVFYIVLAVLVLGAQLLMAGRQPAPPPNDAPTKTTESTLPPSPLPDGKSSLHSDK